MESSKAPITLDALHQVIMSPKASKATAYCLIHGRACEHPRACVHFAGTPCVNFSSMGDGSKCDGRTSQHFAAWASLRLRLREPIIIHENVPEFPLAVLTKFFGHLYNIQSVELHPDDYGWASRRPRAWRVLTLKQCSIQRPVSVIENAFRRPCAMTYLDYLVEDDEHLQQERQWAASRPSNANKHLTSESSFYDTLTDVERDYLSVYREHWPGAVCMLGQNPRRVPIVSSRTTLNTVIKHAGLMWTDRAPQPRWLSPRELLLSQGFPFEPRNKATTSFHINREALGFTAR